MIKILVNGSPAPQGSKRHVGGGRMVEASAAVGPWRDAVRGETQLLLSWLRGDGWRELAMTDLDVLTTSAPAAVTIVFRFARPAGHFGKGRNAAVLKPSAPRRPVTMKRNDIDKLARATLDGLVDGGAMADDAQVVDLNLSKIYCAPGETPGAVIEIEGA